MFFWICLASVWLIVIGPIEVTLWRRGSHSGATVCIVNSCLILVAGGDVCHHDVSWPRCRNLHTCHGRPSCSCLFTRYVINCGFSLIKLCETSTKNLPGDASKHPDVSNRMAVTKSGSHMITVNCVLSLSARPSAPTVALHNVLRVVRRLRSQLPEHFSAKNERTNGIKPSRSLVRIYVISNKGLKSEIRS